MIGRPYDDPKLGPIVMSLTDSGEDEMFGRDGFFIHGDNARHDASHGCIILGPLLRKMIAESNDAELKVI